MRKKPVSELETGSVWQVPVLCNIHKSQQEFQPIRTRRKIEENKGEEKSLRCLYITGTLSLGERSELQLNILQHGN